MVVRPRIRALLVAAALLAPARIVSAQAAAAPEVLLRLDDIGMNHSVNLAIEQVAKTGMPISASVMFACPWYQEAVEILKKYPNVTVGVHLALNSEWRNYRWGPVLGKAGAPSLVDANGYFHPSVPAFLLMQLVGGALGAGVVLLLQADPTGASDSDSHPGAADAGLIPEETP